MPSYRKGREQLSENAFTLFHQIISGVETLMYGAWLAAFLRPFLEPDSRCRKGCSLRRKLFFVFLVYSAVFLTGSLLFFNGGSYMLVTMGILTACTSFLGIDRKFLLLLCALFFCIRNLSVIVMRSADYFSSSFLLAGADTLEKVFLLAALDCVLIDTLQLLLFSLMLCAIRRQLGGKGLALHIRELGRLLLLPAAGILFVNICIRFLIVNDDGHIFQLYEQVPMALGLLPTVAALLYGGTLATLASFRKILALQKERDRYLVEQQQLSAIRERMAQLEQTYDAVRRMKHEMRGHLANIKGLAESGSYQDIDHYIARMEDGLSLFEPVVHTGNAITDVIISDKQKSAVFHGVDFRSEFRYPVSCGYDAYDIGIILSNLLQNALEACMKQTDGKKYIFLSGRQKKRFFLIDIRNSFNGEVYFDRHTRLPISTKEDDCAISRKKMPDPALSVHGIGLSNVRKEAEKYCGNMDIQIDGKEFRVTVLLQGKGREGDSGQCAHEGFPGT